MARLFGTDGVRGVANEELTPLMAMHGKIADRLIYRVEITLVNKISRNVSAA